MKSLLWLVAVVTIVVLITQIKTGLGIQGPVVISSVGDLFWAWRGVGAFLFLFGALSVSGIGLLQSIKVR